MKCLLCFLTLIFLGGIAIADTNLGLADAVSMALEHSKSIKSAEESVKSAASDYKSAKSERYPTLTTELSAFYMTGIPEASIPMANNTELTFSFGKEENYQIDLKFNLPLYTGGKIKSGIETADRYLKIKENERELERLNVAYNCRRAYLALMIASSAHLSAEASLKRIEIINNDVTNLYNNGIADSIDLLEAGLAYEEILIQTENLKNEKNIASIVLANEIGLDDAGVIVPSENIIEPVLPELPQSVSVASLNRPELNISQNMIAASEHMIKLNKAGYMPNIGSFVGYTGGKPNRNLITGLYNSQLTIGAGLDWSLNLGGKTNHKIQSAKAAKLSAEYESDRIEDLLALQANTASENLRHAFNSWKIYSRELIITQERYRLAKIKHNEGELSVNRLLEIEAELTGVEELSKVSKVNYYLKYTDYLYAIGSDMIYGGLK